MNKRNYTLIALVTLTLMVVLSVFYWERTDKTNAKTVFVSTTKAEMSSGNETPVLGGKLEAKESANVVSKITGKVGTVNVDIGSQVKAGDILLTLDAPELAASVSQAQAAVDVARYNIEAAQIDYETAKYNYDRNKILLDQGAISQSVFENTYSQPFKKAEQYVKYGAQAQMQQALSALELAQANYANSVITSPITGIVTAKSINPGELATSSTPLITVVNLDNVVMQTAVDESYINALQEGDPLTVNVGAVSSQLFQGSIANISQAASTTSKGFMVKILIGNSDHLLKPGMFAEASLKTIAHTALTVPNGAIISDGDKNYVWIVENGMVSKKEVVKGTVGAVKTVVKSGLTEGQEVVTSGMEQLIEGLKVTVQP